MLITYSIGLDYVKAKAMWVEREPSVNQFANYLGASMRTGKYIKDPIKHSPAITRKSAKYFILVVVFRST